MIATKTNGDYSQVMCNIRIRLSMDIMRSVLVAVKGVCWKEKKAWTAPIINRRGHGRLSYLLTYSYSGCTPMAAPLPVGGRNV